MAIYKAEIEINAVPQRVFDYVADLTRHGEWSAHGLQVESLSPGATGAGSKYRSVGHQFGTNTNDVSVTEVASPQRFAFESTGKEGRFRHTFELQPAGSGTQVTKSFQILKANGPLLFFQIFLPFISPRGLRADLRRIKARLEQP
jgi:uncharacterized protein YndB with AHSA1/START domain